jgi:type I restriction enzyme S subunit
MSEWKKVKLKNCCHSISDGDHLPPPKSESGVPFITIANIDATNHIDFCNTMFVPFEYYDNLNNIRKARCNDILYSVVGSFGKPVLVKDNIPFAFQRHIAILRPNNEIADSRFLYYILLTRDFYMQADTVAIGAAQRTISLTALRNMEVELPPMEIQLRIASILSRYDSLIENYQKQIKLLEEAAQRLYKEWFVDFHFPGHENTKIVDGVPEGWEKKPVDSIYSIKYGKNLSTKLISESGEFPVYGANGVIGYYDKANCNEQVVLITSRGNGSGDVLMTYHKDAFITNNSFIVSPLEDYSYCLLPFTYQFLKNANFRAVRTGAAQPQLTNQSIHTVDVVLPSKDVIIDYCENISYNNRKIILLKNQIRFLTEARDRLLPKLMSGDIEI